MLRYVAGRLLQAVLVVWAAFTVAFFVLFWMPGDAVLARIGGAGEGADLSAAEIDALRAEYGLDQPVLVQYFSALVRLLTGDLGASVRTGAPVTEVIGEALPHTLALAASALVLGALVGGALALAATYTRSRTLRRLLGGVPAVGIALPTFWVGLLLIFFFSFQLRLLPAGGNAGLPALILPAVTLALPTAAVVGQILMKSMDAALAEPYIATARAKGVGRGSVHLGHALRNALLPVVTMLGLLTGNLIAGSVAVETVFSRSGIGRVTVEAVDLQDLPLILGLVVTGAGIFVIVNLVVDLAYPLIDPRVRLVRKAAR
jgi:peptide/nickel transport system permease protein